MDKSLTDFPKHETNPFMQELLYMRNTRNKIVAAGKIYGAFDQQTGVVQENNVMRSVVVERVDKEQFVRVFDNYLSTIFDLSKRALMVLKYTMNALKFNDDSIYFDIKEARKITGYTSRVTIFAGLAELVERGVLARSEKVNFYFINPKAFCKGNRLDMVKIWVTKNTPEDTELLASISQREAAQKQLNMFDAEGKPAINSQLESV